MRLQVFIALFLGLVFRQLSAQDMRTRWVDSVFATLNREAKIGQLFMVPLSASLAPEERQAQTELILHRRVGGVYVTQGGPLSHVHLLNQLQSQATVPLLAGLSAEWGLAQVMDSTLSFPKPFMASAWNADSLRWQWAGEIGRQIKLLGFNLNFAPHIDDEIFEGDFLRYFSDDPALVARHAVTFSNAMHSQGVLTVARHLPREQKERSNNAILLLNASQIDTAELLPLNRVIQAKVDGIMTNNLHFAVQTPAGNTPAALSSVFVSDILKKRLGFDGLLFCEVSTFATHAGMKDGDAELASFLMGTDVMIAPLHLQAAIRKINKQVKKNKLLQAQLDQSVRKILAAKYNAGLAHWEPVDPANLNRRLHSPEAHLLKQRLAEATPSVLVNRNETLPINQLDNKTFECISIGRPGENEFVQYLQKYVPLRSHSVRAHADTAMVSLQPGSTVFVALFHPLNEDETLIRWINRLATSHKLIVTGFAFPELLTRYTNADAVIAAYEEGDNIPSIVPQIIFGAIPGIGEWPMKSNDLVLRSVRTSATDRLSYSVPEAAGMDSRTLEKIRPIMNDAINSGATPGCQVLVAKDGKIVFAQSAGWLTYANQSPVDDQTIYDLASLTKVTATLQTVMFMYEHGLIDIDKKASVYLPELRESNKKDFTIKDILTHQAGLWPFLPFWAQTMKDSLHMPEFYSVDPSEAYPYPVAQNLFASKAMKDSLWQWIIKAKVREKPSRTPYDYRYSDMGFYIMQHLAEKILNQPMEDFLAQNLYEPLGAYTTGFLPLNRFTADRIAPTEDDKLFRKRLLTGYVHDQGAAMHGGIAGHAGLFSTANDLAKLGQMWLQEGHYGGEQFFKPATLQLFTARQYDNSRRGLGWDKPPQGDWSGPTSLLASTQTFGHTGFTGTCIWVDPAFNLVFIFLSNRVHPDMNNNKLLNANVRSRVQEVVYQAIFNYCATHAETKGR